MASCRECGRPWGVILNRGEQATPERVDAARAEMIEDLLCDAPDWDVDSLPPVKVDEVVFVTEALARFAQDVTGDWYIDGDCWYVTRDVDIPGWMLKGRARRLAVRWDCCQLDLRAKASA